MRGRSSATPTLLQVKRCANTAAGTGFPPAKRSIPNSAALRHGSQTTAVSYGATSFIGGCRRETSSGTGAAMVNRRQRPFCAYFPMTATTSLISLTFYLNPTLNPKPATLRRRFHGSVANSSQATPGTSASTSTSTSNSSDHTCLERCSFEAGCKKSEVGAREPACRRRG